MRGVSALAGDQAAGWSELEEELDAALELELPAELELASAASCWAFISSSMAVRRERSFS